MDVRCRANRACIASLSPAAMRLTKMASDEVSPARAAIADTAAAADFGRFNASIMENSPLLTSRHNKQGAGVRFLLFFLKTAEPADPAGDRPTQANDVHPH